MAHSLYIVAKINYISYTNSYVTLLGKTFLPLSNDGKILIPLTKQTSPIQYVPNCLFPHYLLPLHIQISQDLWLLSPFSNHSLTA